MEEQEITGQKHGSRIMEGLDTGGCVLDALLECGLEILPIIFVVVIVAFVVLGLLTAFSGSGEVLDAGSRLNLK